MSVSRRPSRVFSLYTDGSQSPVFHRAGTGFWLASPTGQLLHAQSMEIEDPSLHAHFELVAIVNGVRKAYELGVRQLRCYCDCRCLVEKLNKVLFSGSGLGYMQSVVEALHRELSEFLSEFSLLEFIYLPRRFNAMADRLSRQYLKEDIRELRLARLDRARRVFGGEDEGRDFFMHPCVQYADHHLDRTLSGKSRNAHKRAFVDSVFPEIEVIMRLRLGKSHRLSRLRSVSLEIHEPGAIKRVLVQERRPHEHAWDCALRLAVEAMALARARGFRKMALFSDNIDFNLRLEGLRPVPVARLAAFRGLYAALGRTQSVCFYPMLRKLERGGESSL